MPIKRNAASLRQPLINSLMPISYEKPQFFSSSSSPLRQWAGGFLETFQEARNGTSTLGSRKQQLQTLLSDLGEQTEISAAEKEINQKAKLFFGSFGLAAVGSLIYAPLSILSLPVALYILKDVYKGSINSLFNKRELTVDTLVSVLMTLLIAQGYFLSCNLYLALYLLNRKLMLKLKHHSSNNIVDVFKQSPRMVWVLSDGIEIEVPFEAVEPGDIVVVNAGEMIPVDGLIIGGIATVDQQLLTGESQPVEKAEGEQVFALTVVLAGRIELQVDKTGEETAAAQIGEILNQTVDLKTNMQLWSERITDRTVLPTFLLTGLAWSAFGPISALVVLNSHFRYRLTLITSTSVLNFLNLAAQKGILIKDGRTLELLHDVDTVVFDKTGTLTLKQPHISQIHACVQYNQGEILSMAAAAEYKQTHPIALAILDAASERALTLPTIDQAEYCVGYGVTVSIDGHAVHVGSHRFITMEACTMPIEMVHVLEECDAQGHSLVFVAFDHQVIGAIELHATVRPEAEAIVGQLREQLGASMYIISGDQEAPTKRLAGELGIEHYFAETLPEDKADLIGKLQAEGKTICYIGDGINDSIALKKAQVSASLRGASSVAIDSADVILMDSTLNQLGELFTLAQDFKRNISTTSKGIMIPCLFNLGGALFPQFTLLHSMLLSGVSVVAGFGSAMSPLLGQQQALSSQTGVSALSVKNVE